MSLFFSILYHSNLSSAEEATTLNPIVVKESKKNDLSIKKHAINRVELIKGKSIQRKQAQTFAQAIAFEKGIDTQTACAFCGAKRISINGLKGEHTTILIDGLPLHSTVSGFYGVEAIPLGIIDSIEVYRGSGAALTAPEAIGGAVNIVTKDIVTSGFELDASLANDGQNQLSGVASKVINENSGLMIGVQNGQIMPLDLDGNGVAELPRQSTKSVFGKYSLRPNETDQIDFRISYSKLETIGGTMRPNKITSAHPTLADSKDFEDTDVRKKFIGDENKITDNVNLDRLELATHYKKEFDSESTLKSAVGLAVQNQKAVYSHGYDYDNKDVLYAGMLEYQRVLNEHHLGTIGLDVKIQQMDSTSTALYQAKKLKQDDLSYKSQGIYIQDTWLINENNELSSVIRFDQIQTKWSDLDRDIDQTLIAPRFFYKHLHNNVLTSRFAVGLGYRSPLTLFESQHGTDHNGFILQIDRLETAKSYVYSLSGQRQDDFFSIGAHLTQLQNMAYGVDQAIMNQPTIFKNSNEEYSILALDLSYGRRILPTWTFEGIFESFDYPSGYKQKLPVAAIEKRLSLISNVEINSLWTMSQKLIVIGERQLSEYGYNKHYNKIYKGEDPLDFDTFNKVYPSDQKFQKSPTYFTLDLSVERKLNKSLSANFSILNVFDYTQTGAGDSPTTWHLHGDHYHLDQLHIWGPLRGRQFFLNLKAQL